jgi:LmbE family N-acetylglucosaminyl deacetylase
MGSMIARRARFGGSDTVRCVLDDFAAERILVVTAHPDDVDFGAAGSVAAWTDRGIEVSYCIVTDGDAGGADTGIPRSEMADVRHREQTAAAKTVGVTDLHWLGFPDGRVEATLDLRKAITRVIRLVRPDRVVTQSPERVWTRIYASHPDHLAAAEATICAVYPDSRNAWAFPELLDDEGLEPHTVPELWLMARDAPDRFVETTDVFHRKVEALLCHESQMQGRETAIEPMLREWSERLAIVAGLPQGRTAEGFQRIDTR